jgi:hypothetical protein
MGSEPTPTPRAAWWEVLGAWLHLWTPPRGVEVPPVPWRWVGVGAAGVAAAVAAWLVLGRPAIDEAKREGVTEQARRAAVSRRAEEARLRRDQRVTVVRLRSGPLAPQVVAAVEAGARARLRTGELGAKRIRDVRCDPAERFTRDRLRFHCLAVEIEKRSYPPLRIGKPFVAVVSADRRSLAWCKVNLVAGEGAAFSQVTVPLPKPCAR